MRRRVAKNRARTDWQLDLKPVALTPPSEHGASSNGSGAYPRTATPPAAAPQPPPAAAANPALTRALGELRATDEAVLSGLSEIRVALVSMQASIHELAGRLGAMEARMTAPRPPAARPVRETSQALRDSSVGPLERRTRRTPAKPDESSEK